MLTRRQFMSASSAAVVLGSQAWAKVAMAAIKDPMVSGTFSHGVASGEPRADGVLLWTRVSGLAGSLKVRWVVATDLAMHKVVKQGLATTSGSRDYCVKVDVAGLEPSTRYYYQFTVDGVASEIGRTKTLADGALDQLNIAVVSCSNFPFGYFNAYEHIAQDDSIDVVLHLGDYIYEYGPDGYGGSVGAKIGRNHEPRHEIITLQDYRTRHGQYKADRASRLMHAAHPLIAIWDDHESANNPYVDGAQNHQPETEGDWSERRAVSLQAYFEWMPVRSPAPGEDPSKLWRHFEFGELASLVTLETRHTARGKQVDYAEYLAGLDSDEKAAEFVESVMWDASRNMISSDMEQFYREAFGHSRARWHLVGNQIPMARTHVPPLADIIPPAAAESSDPLADERNALQVLSRFSLPIYSDTWDGYPAARERFYAMNKALGLQDLLVLTGDSHSFWLNQLFDKAGAEIGYEIGTTGVTSPGDFIYFSEDVAVEMDKRLASHNPEVLWTDGISKGYVKLTLTHDRAEADYIAVSDILSETYDVQSVRREAFVKDDKGQLKRV